VVAVVDAEDGGERVRRATERLDRVYERADLRGHWRAGSAPARAAGSGACAPCRAVRGPRRRRGPRRSCRRAGNGAPPPGRSTPRRRGCGCGAARWSARWVVAAAGIAPLGEHEVRALRADAAACERRGAPGIVGFAHRPNRRYRRARGVAWRWGATAAWPQVAASSASVPESFQAVEDHVEAEEELGVVVVADLGDVPADDAHEIRVVGEHGRVVSHLALGLRGEVLRRL
jgi:hypothetical protein